MTIDTLVPLTTDVIEARDHWKAWLAAARQAHPVLDIILFLSALSGAFWFLSSFCGYLVLKIHDSLDESLAGLLAVAYNVVLGVAFSAVLVLSIIQEKGGSDNFLAYEAAGFAFAYLVLGAVYAERTGEISEYAILGYAAGLLSYLAFCVHTELVGGIWARRAYASVRWVIHGWGGKAAVAWSFGQGAAFVWHALHRRARAARAFSRRFFFKLR